MKHRQRVTKGGKSGRRGSTAAARKKTGRRKGLTLRASAESSKPIKKPVTLRLDADVLAWFKRDGRRYQTRINAALRRVMEREMKAG